jgi:hypothetical protein
MISTTSYTNPTLLGWQGWKSSSSQPTSSKTGQSVSAGESGSTTLAEVLEELRNLRAKVDAQNTNPVAGLPSGAATTAGALDPTRLASLLAGGRSGVGGISPFTQAGLGTSFSTQQGGAVDLTAGSVISPSTLLA